LCIPKTCIAHHSTATAVSGWLLNSLTATATAVATSTLFVCLIGRQIPFLFKFTAFVVNDGLAPECNELLAYMFLIIRFAVNHGQCNHFLTMFFGEMLRSEALCRPNVNSINECCCPCFFSQNPNPSASPRLRSCTFSWLLPRCIFGRPGKSVRRPHIAATN
jgi:hypothetical protein